MEEKSLSIGSIGNKTERRFLVGYRLRVIERYPSFEQRPPERGAERVGRKCGNKLRREFKVCQVSCYVGDGTAPVLGVQPLRTIFIAHRDKVEDGITDQYKAVSIRRLAQDVTSHV